MARSTHNCNKQEIHDVQRSATKIGLRQAKNKIHDVSKNLGNGTTMNQPFGEMSKSLCTTYLCRSILNPNNYIQLLSLTQHPKWYRIIHILHTSQIKVKLFSSQTVSLLPGGCAICNLKTQLARNRTCCRCKMVRGCKLTPWNSPLNWPILPNHLGLPIRKWIPSNHLKITLWLFNIDMENGP
jgi:hypothetical protein